jgi:hypothetical protein
MRTNKFRLDPPTRARLWGLPARGRSTVKAAWFAALCSFAALAAWVSPAGAITFSQQTLPFRFATPSSPYQ